MGFEYKEGALSQGTQGASRSWRRQGVHSSRKPLEKHMALLDTLETNLELVLEMQNHRDRKQMIGCRAGGEGCQRT